VLRFDGDRDRFILAEVVALPEAFKEVEAELAPPLLKPFLPCLRAHQLRKLGWS
jgi:hypothetical protein